MLWMGGYICCSSCQGTGDISHLSLRELVPDESLCRSCVAAQEGQGDQAVCGSCTRPQALALDKGAL